MVVGAEMRPFLFEANMAQDFAKQFYRSRAWQKCRAGYIASANRLCQRCLKAGRIESGKIVHHKVLLTQENINDSIIALGWDNLELLCQDCHNQEHHGNDEAATREDVMFDINGNLICKRLLTPPIKKLNVL